MPAPATHYIFAKSIEDGIRKEFGDFHFSSAAFYYGTQGPDFMFSHKVWRLAYGGKNLIDTGSVLHHVCPSKMFALMKEYLENGQCDRDLIRSYIYGFLAHYALDKNAHPLVYATQKEFTKAYSLENCRSIVAHNLIEMNIDTILIEKELSYKRGIDFRLYKTLDKNEYLIDEMSGLMEYIVPQLTFCDASRKDFADAYRGIRAGQIATGDLTGMRRKIISVIEKPLGKALGGPLLSSLMRQPHCDNKWDYLNITHKEWAYPYDSRVKSTKSFLDLFEDAKKDVPELIRAFNSEEAEKAIREYSGDISFDTGVRYDITEPLA